MHFAYELIGLKLDDCIKKLEGYSIKLECCNAHTFLNKAINIEEFLCKRVVAVHIDGSNVLVRYALFKDID